MEEHMLTRTLHSIFGMWISPTFQLYIVKEYQRLKEQESNPLSLEWNAKRILSKTNYTLHTDAIKNVIIPKMDINAIKHGIIYATEADMLNIILLGVKQKNGLKLTRIWHLKE